MGGCQSHSQHRNGVFQNTYGIMQLSNIGSRFDFCQSAIVCKKSTKFTPKTTYISDALVQLILFQLKGRSPHNLVAAVTRLYRALCLGQLVKNWTETVCTMIQPPQIIKFYISKKIKPSNGFCWPQKPSKLFT